MSDRETISYALCVNQSHIAPKQLARHFAVTPPLQRYITETDHSEMEVRPNDQTCTKLAHI